MSDPVKTPDHYRGHPSGIECIEITKHMTFNLGNALKYIWRCDLKKDAIEDLEKARQYLDIEIQMRKDKAEAETKAAGERLDRLMDAYAIPKRYITGMDPAYYGFTRAPRPRPGI